MQCGDLLLSLNLNRATIQLEFYIIINHTNSRTLWHDLLVNDVEPKPVPSSLHLGDQVPNLLDTVHLLSQIFRLQEVAQVGVSEVGGHFVDVEKTLIDL